jgi:hypothetical protein
MHIFADKGADMSAARDVAEQAAKGSIPVVTTAIAWLSSIPLDRWLIVFTIIYTLLQIYVLVRDRIYRPWRAARLDAAAVLVATKVVAMTVAPPKADDGISG